MTNSRPPTNGLFNDGSADAPKLRVFMNFGTLAELPAASLWSGEKGIALYQRLATDDFEGVQLGDHSPPPAGAPLPHCGLDRLNLPAEADEIAARHAARGDLCLTVHAGWGLEDDSEAYALVEAILAASERHRLPIFIETHRATLTQDLWRTVQITKEFPEVRFNGDFSHYYCGQEMVYGGMEMKLAFLEPIFSRIGFLHGRIASPGSMQVPISEDLAARPRHAHGAVDYLEHFRELWTRAMLGFLRRAGSGDVLVFAPELLS